ncbi:DUF4139 domain-containing protein [uncultured Tateyamaria sp.]|uniref:DUF4139 domain-containing protein n=1 Tax=uncultured Tateyamaria sp. TaxID=455651 RepID=UPI002601CF01|nr:DUF4139 domain-containing protein [uncultured Tateyamaria sp.]
MRLAAALLCALPFAAHADTFTLTAPPVAVTAYASGAMVTRTAKIDLPAGQHEVRIDALDATLQPGLIDISLDGATLLSRQWDENRDTPYRAPRTPAWLDAKARLDAATEALALSDNQIARARAMGQAADDQIRFLNGITLPGEAATDVDALRAIGQLIASDGTAARGAMQDAAEEVRRLTRDRADLTFAIQQARAALDAVTPRNDTPATLALRIDKAEDGPLAVTLRYPTPDVGWTPVYRLDLTDDTALTIRRSAEITQASSEDWQDVTLTLSTLSPFGPTEPAQLQPFKRVILDPDAKQPLAQLPRRRGVAFDRANVGIMAETAATLARTDISDIGVTYTLPGTVTVPAQTGTVQIALDTLRFDASLLARAVPRADETAYRQVNFANTSPEILLPGAATLYVDGQLIGQTTLDTQPPGAETDIFFGRIEGLRIDRTVLDRNAGDRGLISRSNEQSETIQIDVENLTDRTWDVRLRDVVPHSEQEDLVIEWTATPAPDQTAVDNQRGILEWEFDIDPATTRTITIDTRTNWPEGMILR